MNIVGLSLCVVLLCFSGKTVSANVIESNPAAGYFLSQLIKIFSSCEPTYKLTYFTDRGLL